MFQDMSLKDFLEKTASRSPVPGGGSVAALSASLSASLIEMVANLTIGKKDYEDIEEEMKEVIKAISSYRDKFVKDIDKDSEAFNQVMMAFKLPKNLEEEKNIRKQVIQDAFKNAVLVPLGVAKGAYEIMDLAEKIVDKGNKNAVTDGAVAAMMARTAVLSALYNVKINLGYMKNTEFVKKVKKEVEDLESKVVDLEKQILSKVDL